MSNTEILEKRMARARWFLHNHHPFFCRLGQSLATVWTNQIHTAAVDANGHMYLNPDFATRCSDSDLVFIYSHEIMHLVQMCHGRAPMSVIHKPWNIAADACINPILVDDCKMPICSKEALEGGRPIYGAPNSKNEDERLWHMLGKGTTEQAYYYLLKNPEKTMGQTMEELMAESGMGNDGNSAGNGPGNQGHSGPTKPGKGKGGQGALDGRWWDDSGARIIKKATAKGKDPNTGRAMSNSGGMTEEQRAQWTQKIASAACAAKTAGKFPGALDQYITTLLKSKRNWKNELRAFTTSVIKDAYTWKRIGRRCASLVRTPGRLPRTPTAVVYIDTSGSMSDQELQRCLSETFAIAKLCNAEVHLILGDAEIYFSGVKKMNDLSHLKEVQRGGTDFNVLFDHIEDTMRTKPAILIGFTDLCGPFPEKAPSYPVVWCQPGSGYQGTAPWGKVIKVDL